MSESIVIASLRDGLPRGIQSILLNQVFYCDLIHLPLQWAYPTSEPNPP